MRRTFPLGKLGAYRLDFERCQPPRFTVRRAGRATPWPWRELCVPAVGSFIVSRTRPKQDGGA